MKEDISERLCRAYHVDSSEVSVEVRGGKVTLEGTVPSRHMKHAIEDMVDDCPGVMEIDNRVRVASPNYQGSSQSSPTGPTVKSSTKQ
jgi:osmotically-inducible protein OsmY